MRFLGILLYIFARLITLTYRYRFHGLKNRRDAENSTKTKKFIFAFWHQNILTALTSHPYDRALAIVSPSKDGEYVAIACQKFGHDTIRGSSDKSALKTLLEMIRVLKKGEHYGAISIDGPKGPLYEIKRGIIDVAKKTKLPILPLAIYPEHFFSFKSWDQFRLPLPFTKVHIIYGEPLFIDGDLPIEKYESMTQRLREILFAAEKNRKDAQSK